MKNSALIWHDVEGEVIYRDTLSPSSDIWLLLWLDDRGITSYEAWEYIWYSSPRKLVDAGCLLQRFFAGSEGDWRNFIRTWYWTFYKREGLINASVRSGV